MKVQVDIAEDQLNEIILSSLKEDYQDCVNMGNNKSARAISKVIRYYSSVDAYKEWKKNFKLFA